MFHRTVLGVALTAALSYIGPASAGESVPLVDLNVRVAEIDRDVIEQLPLGRDFSDLVALQPAFGGILERPAGLVPSGVPVSGDPDDLDTVIRALENEGLVRVLSAPSFQYGATQTGAITVINQRKDIEVSNEAGTVTKPFNVGVTLDIRPQIVGNGLIDLDLNLTGDYVEFEGGDPILDSKRVATTVTIPNGQTLVIGGLFDQGSREAASKLPVLGDIPGLGAMFKSPDFYADKTDFLIFVTPTLAGVMQTSSGGPAPVAPGQFEVTAGVGYGYQGMPSFGWLRTETMFMGNIVTRPFVSEDSDFEGAEWRIGVTGGLPFGALGGIAPRIGFEFSYFDADTDSFTNFIDAEGNGLGIEDPTGSGVFITPGFGDLYDVQFDAEYEALDTTIKVIEDFDLSYKKDLSLGAGLNIRYSDFEADLSAVTNGNTLNIARSDSVETWFIAPTIEGRLSHNYGGILTAYGGAALSAGVGVASGFSKVDVGNSLLGKLDLRETDFVYKAGINAGALIDLNPIIVDITGEVNFSNFTPVINYQPFSEAQLDFESDVGAFFGITASYKFN